MTVVHATQPSCIRARATQGKCDAKELLPSGVSVSRHTQDKCGEIKAQLLPEIQRAISEAQACGAATDMWTDDYRKVSYTCIKLHFVDENWEYQSRLIYVYLDCVDSRGLGYSSVALQVNSSAPEGVTDKHTALLSLSPSLRLFGPKQL